MSSNQLPIAENGPDLPKRAQPKWYKNPKIWRQGWRVFTNSSPPADSSSAWGRVLRNLTYVVLAVIIALTWWTGAMIFRDAECNHCLDCVVDCPKPNVLRVQAAKWRFSYPAYATLLIVGLFGVIGVSKATNAWQTKPEEVSVRNASGEPEAETIRGWMTLNIISREFGIPLEQLYADTQLPAKVLPDVVEKYLGEKQ